MEGPIAPALRSQSSSLPSRKPLARNASSGHTLLVGDPDNDTSPDARKRQSRYGYRILKAFGLSIFYTMWTKREAPEKQKIAFDNRRRMAFTNSLIHWIPFLAAGLLIAMNLLQYYIGGDLAGENNQNTQKLAGLQFAAKLHELSMLASISTTTFAYIRKQMISDGVTLGTVFAGQGFKSISNLWSLEFWSTVYDACMQERGKKRNKWWLVILIALATVLGVAVGPSSATLMRPRLDWWPAGGTAFWLNATREEIYPKVLSSDSIPSSCANYTGDMLCSYGNFESLIELHARRWRYMRPMGMNPGDVYLPSQLATRKLKTESRSSPTGNGTIWRSGRPSTFWAPLAGVADAISESTRLWSYAAFNSPQGKRFKYRQDVSFSVEALQPEVQVFCSPNSAENLDSATDFPIDFAIRPGGPETGAQIIHDYGPFGRMWTYSTKIQFEDTGTSNWLQQALFNTTTPSILWYNGSQLEETNSSLLAVVAVPQSSYGFPAYFGCSIRAFYRGPTTTVGYRNNHMQIIAEPSGGWVPVNVSSSWAEYTNPYLPDEGTDVFSRLASAAGLSLSYPPLTQPSWIPYAIESVIGTMLVSGMSKMPYNLTLAGHLKGITNTLGDWSGGPWTEEYLPTTQLGWGGHAYEVSPKEAARTTQFELKARVNGYAYSREGTAQIAAMAVLFFYCLLALGSIFNTWRSPTSRMTSSAWDTIPELTALALNSERSDAMYNTGAGIDSIRTMEHRVVVRSIDNRLEMVFADTGIRGDKVSACHPYH